MKRTIATLAAVAGMVVWTGDVGVSTHAGADQSHTRHNATANSRPLAPTELPYNWEEDDLPVELYLWADCNANPSCNVHRVRGRFEGRRGCWRAVNDTTMTACPTRDNKIGYVAYS